VAEASTDVALFIYGTLTLPVVQLETFGRLLGGDDDALSGYTVDYLDRDDPHAADLTGHGVHAVVRHTGNPLDKVMGIVTIVTEDELDAADEYEIGACRRTLVRLDSGANAWTYAPRP